MTWTWTWTWTATITIARREARRTTREVAEDATDATGEREGRDTGDGDGETGGIMITRIRAGSTNEPSSRPSSAASFAARPPRAQSPSLTHFATVLRLPPHILLSSAHVHASPLLR